LPAPLNAIDQASRAALVSAGGNETAWRPLAAWVRIELSGSAWNNAGVRVCPQGCLTTRLAFVGPTDIPRYRTFEWDGDLEHRCTHDSRPDQVALVALDRVLEHLPVFHDIQPFGTVVTADAVYLVDDDGRVIADSARSGDRSVFYAAGWTEGPNGVFTAPSPAS